MNVCMYVCMYVSIYYVSIYYVSIYDRVDISQCMVNKMLNMSPGSSIVHRPSFDTMVCMYV